MQGCTPQRPHSGRCVLPYPDIHGCRCPHSPRPSRRHGRTATDLAGDDRAEYRDGPGPHGHPATTDDPRRYRGASGARSCPNHSLHFITFIHVQCRRVAQRSQSSPRGFADCHMKAPFLSCASVYHRYAMATSLFWAFSF